jgi:hypothetical protein
MALVVGNEPSHTDDLLQMRYMIWHEFPRLLGEHHSGFVMGSIYVVPRAYLMCSKHD